MGAIYSLIIAVFIGFSVDSEVPHTAIEEAFESVMRKQ